MGVKPVTTPVSVYANLLFCRFIRQGKKTGLPRGCKCDWHRSQLARSAAESRSRQSEGRDEKLGFRCIRCLHVTAQSDRVPKFQIWLEAKGRTALPLQSSLFVYSIKTSERWRTHPVAQTWHTRVCHTQPSLYTHTDTHTHTPLSSALFSPPPPFIICWSPAALAS